MQESKQQVPFVSILDKIAKTNECALNVCKIIPQNVDILLSKKGLIN